MLVGVVKRERLIVMRSAVHEISCVQRRRTRKAMPNHKRNGRPLLLSEREILGSQVAQHIAVEGSKVRVPKAVEHVEQQRPTSSTYRPVQISGTSSVAKLGEIVAPARSRRATPHLLALLRSAMIASNRARVQRIVLLRI